MSLPEMNSQGLLPLGVHDCTLEEMGARFGRFQSTDCRCRLFGKLRQFMQEVRETGLVAEVIVDGSFVTSEEEPGDVDLVIVVRANHDLEADIRPFEYNVLSKRRVRKRHGFDILVAREGHPEQGEYVGFFQQVRGKPDLQKGIVRIRP